MGVVVLLLLLQVTAEKETVSVPNTKISFDVARIPERPGLSPFLIGIHEVTWEEFNAYRGRKGLDAETRPSHLEAWLGDMGIPPHFLEGRRPVVFPRWHTAIAYCEWLSRRTGRYFRLPTEKEWEAAARGGTDAAALDEAAWHQGNSEKRTHDVGRKRPNAFGLYDMLGNVWEYCLDTGSPESFSPILRGGSWSVPAADLSFGLRRTVPESWFDHDVQRPRSVWWLACLSPEQGFRVVCVPDAVEGKVRDEAIAKVDVRIVKQVPVELPAGKGSRDYYCKVTGEVRNGTDRTVEELEVQVFYLTPAGAPHLVDLETSSPGRPTFSKCWPVLKNGSDERAAVPLKPGETRGFQMFVPETFDIPPVVNPNQLGGRVTNVKFAK